MILFKNLRLIQFKSYTAEHFGIETVKSMVDFDNDGIDDYTDIMLGARKDADNHPKYNGKYIAEGYPPDEIGVCSDVIWRAFKNAGYSLKGMIDNDIAESLEDYKNIEKPDTNIDFRRVVNLRVFFDKYAEKLTLDINKIEEWQPGDIVIFGKDKHIGIISDKRNRKGQAYVIHNGGQIHREEDYLKISNVVRHYRFDATTIRKDIFIRWKE
ncbi:DUF1287 domain-containing protein [Sedimentibacter sp. zth1]|nr:DUF1287 domain-containing protein [Sedimentibacter sp. zth1]